MIKNTNSVLRQASTIILVREKDAKIEIYLLKRSVSSGFMGGFYVFPGGVVESEDKNFNTWIPFMDIRPNDIEKQLGDNTMSSEDIGQNISQDILGFSIAAIRETIEEAGVLIARKENKTKADFDYMSEYRLIKGLNSTWFKEKIREKNFTIAISELNRWSHWITPKQMKKRFDTRFFIVFMPDGQSCTPDNKETEHGIWLTPRKALEMNLEKTVPLSPPTLATLTGILQFNTSKDLKEELKKRTWGTPIEPRLIPSENGPVIIEPWDICYNSYCKINSQDLPAKILPPCSPFSRLWCDAGVWKPVAP